MFRNFEKKSLSDVCYSLFVQPTLVSLKVQYFFSFVRIYGVERGIEVI